MTVLLMAGLVVLLANLAILGLNVKLYTEFFKQVAQSGRGEQSKRDIPRRSGWVYDQ